MQKTPFQTPNKDFYKIYRQGMIKRHICKNGRFLELLALVEKKPNTNQPEWDQNARYSEEKIQGTDTLYDYTAYPLLIPSDEINWKFTNEAGNYISGGGDNPLLYGGLALATFSMEVLLDISEHSFGYGKKLLDFILSSEREDKNGQGTGFLTRRRHFWFYPATASHDEYLGVVLGIYFYFKASEKKNNTTEMTRAKDLLQRIATLFSETVYIIPGDGTGNIGYAWIYVYGCIFKDILGEGYQVEDHFKMLRRLGKTLLAKEILLSLLLPTPGLPDPPTEPLAVSTLIQSLMFLAPIDPVANDAFYKGIKVYIYSILSKITPKRLFQLVLEWMPRVKSHQFNYTLASYGIMMLLVSDSTSNREKKELAEDSSNFLKSCFSNKKSKNNALFAILAKQCQVILDNNSNDDTINNAIRNITHPADIWFHDLPLGDQVWILKDDDDNIIEKIPDNYHYFTPFNSQNEYFWGSNYNWCRKDDSYSLTYTQELDYFNCQRRIGPNKRKIENDNQKGPLIKQEDLYHSYNIYTKLSDDLLFEKCLYQINLGLGIHIEASGLDFLFARILLSYFNFEDKPDLENDEEYPVLPTDGPCPETYVGNIATMEIHDLIFEKGSCLIDKILEENFFWKKYLKTAHEEGFDNCGHCIGDSKR